MSNAIEDPLQLLDFPEDIIIDILSRLSVKTLSKFRCVSKSCDLLISSQYFVTQHLHMSTISETFTNHRLIIEPNGSWPEYNFKSCSINGIFNERSRFSDTLEHLHMSTISETFTNHRLIIEPDRHSPEYNFKSCSINGIFNDTELKLLGKQLRLVGRVQIVGSCNGLLLIQDNYHYYKHLYLWNPSIRKSKRLPDIKILRERGDVVYGLGYDKYCNDYKAVAIHNPKIIGSRLKGYSRGRKIQVYSLKSDSWGSIQTFSYEKHAFDDSFGLFLDDAEALIWKLFRLDDQGEYHETIIAYKLSTMTYQELPSPVFGDVNLSYSNLRVFDGSLCLIASYKVVGYEIAEKAELWVMKEYGAGESWTKIISIPYPPNHLSCPSLPFIHKTLCVSKNGQLLVSTMHDNLVLYNHIDNSLLQILPKKINSRFTSLVYVESLVSPYCFQDTYPCVRSEGTAYGPVANAGIIGESPIDRKIEFSLS